MEHGCSGLELGSICCRPRIQTALPKKDEINPKDNHISFQFVCEENHTKVCQGSKQAKEGSQCILCLHSQKIVKDGAMGKALGWNGAKLVGNEAARAREHRMELAKGSERMYGSSDNVVASTEGELSRVNTLLSRQCMSEKESIARLTSLLDGLSMPKPSARTSADVEYTSEPSKVRFRECEEVEDRWF